MDQEPAGTPVVARPKRDHPPDGKCACEAPYIPQTRYAARVGISDHLRTQISALPPFLLRLGWFVSLEQSMRVYYPGVVPRLG